MDCSSKKVRVLLEELIDLRKKAPQEISDFYAKQNKDILKYLNCVTISLQENYESTDYDIEARNPFENLNVKQVHQVDNGLLEKIYEQIQLLQILIKKRNCPISKIIDDI